MKSRTKLNGDLSTDNLQSINVNVLIALFDLTSDVAFFIKNATGEYLAVNESLVARHGLKQKANAIGKRPKDICPGELGELSTEQDRRILSTGKPLIDCLELHWYRPGAPVWCLTSKLPLRSADGRIVGIIGFSRDVRAPVATDEVPVTFARAFADFEKDPSIELTPSILARRSGLSSTRLARLTKKLFSLTPSQLLAKTRITAASIHLQETNLSVADIAQRCGFADQSAFTRAFRSLTGVTPSDFRKKKRDVALVND